MTVNFDFFNKKFYSQTENITHDQILQVLDSNSTVILDFTRDHANRSADQSVTEIKNYLDSCGYKNIFYLTTNKFEDTNDRIIFFPVWMYSKSLAYANIDIEFKTQRQYKISCLNRFPSVHRVYLFYLLRSKSYYNQSLTSFYGLRNPYVPEDTGTKESISNPMYDALPNDIRQNIKELNMYKESIPGDHAWNNDHTFNHPAYLDTYLNIVTESTANYPFFSEKICKPLASGQLLLLVDGQHSIEILRQFGFDLFDDFFNNHSYDQSIEFMSRIDNMLILLDSIYNDIELYFKSNYKRIIENRKLFLSESFRNNLLRPLIDRDLLINM